MVFGKPLSFSRFFPTVVITSSLAISGCGGSSSPQTVSPPPPTPPADNQGPSAKVLFPGTNSRTFEQSILVKGAAEDENGVSEVVVNGKLAELIQNDNDNSVTWSCRNPRH